MDLISDGPDNRLHSNRTR